MAQSLVLLHGWGLNAAVWESIKPQLEQAIPGSIDVHALDLPGFGDAQWKDDLTEASAVADYLADYIQTHTPTGQAAVLGWSMGGLLATTLALRHPHCVTGLYTVASSPCFVSRPDDGWPGMDPTVLKAFQAQLRDDFKTTLKRFLAVQAMGAPSARNDIKQLQALLLKKPLPVPEALQAGLNWLEKVDLRDQLSQLSMPFYRAYGRLDSLVPVAVANQITSGDCEIFASSAHAPFLNQPEDFIDWIKATM
ncbi:pimeloyl-ACP methyl ester esterase BioH [Aliidiomarina soli]|uniref:Pimeloyl-[acyl-carrier protein] methyl ester esterase n=1 Tax=Aliidiomarina soli TaxID=1928574 RepID=A0A432WJP5_9GAMM|nr:pimeloyl-ACP methyl ester esterase BioH [Aliidiomarina soli]RUO33909.1 pimeloyl-[acyl-carrier protein] methyl ester esterase [Aliidiomarina soli]